MKDYLPIAVTHLPQEERMSKMRKRYRESLLYVGKSPDYHIFDLSTDFLDNLKDSKAKRFLNGLRRYFIRLDEEKKRIFVCDILEFGRHYPFWYIEEYTRREYERILREVVEEVPSCLE